MRVVADLHIHSKYSRAVSQDMNLVKIGEWAVKKGINLVATGDWTHPIWFRELKNQLVEEEEGVYKLKSKIQISNYKKDFKNENFFILSTELSCIYNEGGRLRRIHLIVLAPSLETVEKINQKLASLGFNLVSDGRPILGISGKNLAELILEIDKRCLIIPAHAWTPWFSLYGSASGFDSIEECFGEFSKYIYAIETGLSSDPAMNWRIGELESKSIVSFSDAHSPQKLGREVTVFQIQNSKIKNQNENFKISYQDIYDAITANKEGRWKLGFTIEFYPEEGKYHFTGHRNCQVTYSPEDERKKGTICPVCGKNLTIGVMSRVEKLASVPTSVVKEMDEKEVCWIKSFSGERPPYTMLVPLQEVISEALNVGVNSVGVSKVYEALVGEFGNELSVLLDESVEDLNKAASEKVIEGIIKNRRGEIIVEPGYDGLFGKVKIWGFEPEGSENTTKSIDQGTLF